MTPLDDFAYLINHVLLGEEPTIEDFILLIGTLVAFVAFILWCCFPIHPKEGTPGTMVPTRDSNDTNGAYTSSHMHHEHCYTCCS